MNEITFSLLSLIFLVLYFATLKLIYSASRHLTNFNGIEIRVYNSSVVNAFSMYIPFKNVIFTSSEALKIGNEKFRAMVMHEYGHIKLRHTLISLFVTLTTVIITFYLFIIGLRIETFIEIALLLFVQRYISRRMEVEADKFASKYVNKDILISLVRDYGDSKESFLSTHPSIENRVKAILSSVGVKGDEITE